MYKDIDTFIVTHFAARSEVINIRDPITSQMSLIRTHPFDERVNTVCTQFVSSGGDLYHNDPLPSNLSQPVDCVLKKMFNGAVDARCINVNTPPYP